MQDKVYLSSKITDILVKDYIANKSTNTSSAFSMLTSREREVFHLIARGTTPAEIPPIDTSTDELAGEPRLVRSSPARPKAMVFPRSTALGMPVTVAIAYDQPPTQGQPCAGPR